MKASLSRPAVSAVMGSIVWAAASALALDDTAIYVMNVDGSQVRQLAKVNGYRRHSFPQWSHDGKMIAFDAQTQPGNNVRDLFVMNADGSAPRNMGVGTMPSWSPDDKQITFYFLDEVGQSHIVVKNLNGDGRTELGAGKSPRWSPDGSWMVATNTRNVNLIDMATGESKWLFNEPYLEVFRGFKFSPDSKQLAVAVSSGGANNRQLLFVNIGGTAREARIRLKSNLGGTVSFSPDGKRVVFGNDNKIFIAGVEGDAQPELLPGQRGNSIQPDWSPDGRSIVFSSDRKEM